MPIARAQLADLESITYPGFGWETPRTINRTYSKGWLTAVTDPSIGTWASFGYHGNGMLSDVFHRNGVTEDHDRDPNSMGRPRLISTTGVAGGNNWSTGMYRYDGAGNITNIGDSVSTYDTVSRIKSAVIPLTESASGLWNPELALTEILSTRGHLHGRGGGGQSHLGSRRDDQGGLPDGRP